MIKDYYARVMSETALELKMLEARLVIAKGNKYKEEALKTMIKEQYDHLDHLKKAAHKEFVRRHNV